MIKVNKRTGPEIRGGGLGGVTPPRNLIQSAGLLFSRQDCYSVGRTAIWVKYFRAKGKIEVAILENFFGKMEKFSKNSKNFDMSGKIFGPLKWYTDRNFFGDGGGEVAKNNLFRKKFFRHWSVEMTLHPPLKNSLRTALQKNVTYLLSLLKPGVSEL
jgi:hypothetical protein